MELEEVRKNCILYSYRGSIAHNLHKPKEDPSSIDDIDYMGVCIAPMNYYLGLDKFDQIVQVPTMENPDDIVIYDIRKMFRLLLNNNPNVMSLLWNHKDMHIDITPNGQRLLNNRNLFSSKQCYKSFSGYAYSQLQKMENCKHQGYMGAKRKALVEKFGYDCKNASHLIRLLKMGIEFLSDGVMTVYRERDRQQLIDIKEGLWSLNEVKKYAEDLFNSLRTTNKISPLPKNPDYKAINGLLMDIMRDEFKISYN